MVCLCHLLLCRPPHQSRIVCQTAINNARLLKYRNVQKEMADFPGMLIQNRRTHFNTSIWQFESSVCCQQKLLQVEFGWIGLERKEILRGEALIERNRSGRFIKRGTASCWCFQRQVRPGTVTSEGGASRSHEQDNIKSYMRIILAPSTCAPAAFRTPTIQPHERSNVYAQSFRIPAHTTRVKSACTAPTKCLDQALLMPVRRGT